MRAQFFLLFFFSFNLFKLIFLSLITQKQLNGKTSSVINILVLDENSNVRIILPTRNLKFFYLLKVNFSFQERAPWSPYGWNHFHQASGNIFTNLRFHFEKIKCPVLSLKGQTLHHKTVSCGSKLVIFTSVEWQVIPQALFSFAPYSSASPLLADHSSASQQNASVWRNVCWPEGKIGSSENHDGYRHQLPRYPQSKARPYSGSRCIFPQLSHSG